jgi:hypothetical protein
MGISLVGFTGGGLRCDVHADTQDGDFMLWQGGYGGNAAAPLPEGFTNINVYNQGSNSWQRLGYRIACDEPSEHGNRLYSAASLLAVFRKTGGAWVVIADDRWSEDQRSETGMNSSIITMASVTPQTVNDWVIACFYKDVNPNRNVNPAGFTHIGEEIWSGSGGVNMYRKLAGNLDPITAVQTYSGSSNGVAMGFILSVVPTALLTEVLAPYVKRIKCVVPQSEVRADVHVYPLLLNLTDSAGTGNTDASDLFDTLGSESKKIAVTTEDGISQCYVEIESWDASAKQARLWVRAPSISCTQDEIFYLYYSAQVPDNNVYIGEVGSTVGIKVWEDAGYQHVWHLSQDPTGGAGSILDSRGRVDGNPQGSIDDTNLIDSVIPGSKALSFDGSAEWIHFSASGDLMDIADDLRWSMEFLVRPGNIAAETIDLIRHSFASTSGSCLLRVTSAAHPGAWFDGVVAAYDLNIYTTGLTVVDDVWQFVVSQYSGYFPDTNNWFREEVMLDKSWERVNDGTNVASRNVNYGIAIGGFATNKYLYDGAEARVALKIRIRSWHEITYDAMFDTLISYSMEDVTPAIPNAVLGGKVLPVAEMKVTLNENLKTVGGTYVKDRGDWIPLAKTGV